MRVCRPIPTRIRYIPRLSASFHLTQHCVHSYLPLRRCRSSDNCAAMNTLPSLYISHGSPMTALHPGEVGKRLTEIAASMPRPKAIVMASAHWLARQPSVGSAAQPETIHDFYGFPRELFAIRYPAPGAPELAAHIAHLLDQAGLNATLDPRQGLDHGAWVPLRLLYPHADIPVVPLSIQPNLGPAHQYAVGRALAPLREQGVLVIGSGSITHNLHDFRAGYSDTNEAPYVRPFIGWVEEKINTGDLDALLDYRRQAPFAERAHPTDEHLLPLYVALGAAGEHFDGRRIDAGIDMGLFAMDIYRFDSLLTAVTAQ